MVIPGEKVLPDEEVDLGEVEPATSTVIMGFHFTGILTTRRICLAWAIIL